MQIWPAIDLRGGKCVRLRQGDYQRETVYGFQWKFSRTQPRIRRHTPFVGMDNEPIFTQLLGLDADAIARLVAGDADVALFTSATQIEHLRRVAADAAEVRALVSAMAEVVVGSIGPVCSQALRRAGIAVAVEPTHPKMGPLVAETLRAAPALLAARRRSPSLA